jgi:hypothetical protein
MVHQRTGALPVSDDWRASVENRLTRLVSFVDGNGEPGAKSEIRNIKKDVEGLCTDLTTLGVRTFGTPEEEGGLSKRVSEIEKLMIQNQSIIKFGVFIMSALGILIISLLFGIFTGEYSLVRTQ